MIRPWSRPRVTASGLLCAAQAAARPSGTTANADDGEHQQRDRAQHPAAEDQPETLGGLAAAGGCAAPRRPRPAGAAPRSQISSAETAKVSASMPIASRGLHRGGQGGAGEVADHLGGLDGGGVRRHRDGEPVAGRGSAAAVAERAAWAGVLPS